MRWDSLLVLWMSRAASVDGPPSTHVRLCVLVMIMWLKGLDRVLSAAIQRFSALVLRSTRLFRTTPTDEKRIRLSRATHK